jgi:hypothetical protein
MVLTIAGFNEREPLCSARRDPLKHVAGRQGGDEEPHIRRGSESFTPSTGNG